MKRLAACFALLISLTATANTFVVTSNADSGPGTLREAISLAAANGIGTIDTISFAFTNLTISGRTILLQSPLPDLTSNIMIDGTTQAGAKIGVSDARVRVAGAPGVRLEYVFRMIDKKNFWLFGLHINDVLLPIGSTFGGSVVAVMNAENIFIGAPGKGNYFTNIQFIVREADLRRPGRGITTNLNMKSNILNLSEDGNAIVSYGLAFGLNNLRNLEVGGDTDTEGNFMVGGVNHIMATQTDTFANINTGIYRVRNNKFGCNYAQTTALRCASIYFDNGNGYGYTDTTQIIVKNNTYDNGAVVGANWLQNFLRIENKKGFIDVKANKIGLLSSNLSFFYSSISTAITIGGCENGIIGGHNAQDTNFIAGCYGHGIAVGGNRAIEITKNSIYCNSNGIQANPGQLPVPKTKIFTITDYTVAGTTLPDSRVEVFLTKTCTGCKNGKTYLGRTTADAVGNWNFTSPILLDGAVTATGTSSLNNTGEFAKPEYAFDNFLYESPTCSQNNGYIRGIKFVAGTRYYWLHTYNGVVDTLFTENVFNAKPGFYKFVVEQGAYCSVNYNVFLSDRSPKINAQSRTFVQPSCGLNNGKILNHFLAGSYNKVYWKDAADNVVGTTADLHNVGAGQYKLVILDTTYGCGDSTQFYTLTNQSGPSLNNTNIQITPATCGSNSGNITGLTATNVTGTPFLGWIDSVNNVVGSNYDLTNVPPGKYRFKFKDASGCDTIITTVYVVGNTGAITIDTASKIIQPAKCTGNTGSIQNIAVTGGDNYQWRNIATGTVVGTTLNIQNLAAGNYQLTVTNAYGCTKTSPVITIPQAAFVPIGIMGFTSWLAYCGQPNGSLRPHAFSGDTTLYSFRWIDSATNQTVSNYTNAFGIYGATYLLFAKDTNGCERQIFKAVLRNALIPAFDYTAMRTTDDNCFSGKGGIQGISMQNLPNGAPKYVWINDIGDSINNKLDVQSLISGTYRLKTTDAMGCTVTSVPVVINNVNSQLPNPRYNDEVILKGAATQLKVQNNQVGNYQLFDDATATILLQQNATGVFVTPVLATDKTFYVRFVSGVCSSGLVPINITVIERADIYVPTAFTPNNDGRNDVLKPIAHGKFTLLSFQVYNRWGQVVFSSSDWSKGWDGSTNGRPATTGAFVWLLKAKNENTGATVEQKGIVTIIR